MIRINRCFRWGWAVWAVLLLLVSACSKEALEKGPISDYYDVGWDSYYELGPNAMGIGNIQTSGWLRYVQLDASTVCLIVNQDKVEDIPDGTRVFIQYRSVVADDSMPEFFTDAILVFWAIPLDVGDVIFDRQAPLGDPITVISDWMTTLEDGFLTIHYDIPSNGKTSHHFSLYSSSNDHVFRLIHDANGDIQGELKDGLICFDVSSQLPDTEGETVTFSLIYLDIPNTLKTLTFDYRSPQ